ncbi:MAG: hypothetical protein IJ772_02900 [Bacilli bacterium]|nr:hypothetical protein [Bacilli bacterium]
MKKKIALILCIGIAFLGITGCGKKEEEKKTENLSKIELKDEGYGTTTFAYNKDFDFEIKENHSGKYTELIINSEGKNFEWQMYHTDSTEKSYETGKENRKNSKGFKEYEWNGKKGYIYNADKFSLDFNILLNTSDGDAKVLFGSLSYKDSTKADVLNYFQSEEFQKIMNSIEFKE